MSDVNRTDIDVEEENQFRSDKVGREKPPADTDMREEDLDDALEDTFPASDPVQPHQIDGPDN